MEQYSGIKELYELTLRAKTAMTLGSRSIEKDEPVMYFNRATLGALSADSRPVMARGGWSNAPFVIWQDRDSLTFTISEGVVSQLGMALLFGANLLNVSSPDVTYIHKVEGPFVLNQNNKFSVSKTIATAQPHFCFQYAGDCIQSKQLHTVDDKQVTVTNGSILNQYVYDYYYAHSNGALIYLIEKERVRGTFSLQAKFYSKDENNGTKVTNLLIMPRVEVLSNINLRLGERTDPITSVFNILAMPQRTESSGYELSRIIRLSQDIDADY